MKTVLQTFNGLNPCDGDWGLEIEVEGDNLPRAFPGREWRVERDGSLKAVEAYEYVMPVPTSIDGVSKALKVLKSRYAELETVHRESVRAGVHVHMNVQKFTVKQLFTFATCCFILEDLLVKWCGENREGNLFCLRSSDAEYILFAMQEAVEKRNWDHMRTDNLRYCFLNFQSLFKYGSLEFRSMRSTPDLDIIFKWVKILEELRDNSLKFTDPVDVMVSMSGEGEEQFLRRMIPSFYKELEFPGYERAIRKACRRVQMFAFTNDWDTLSRENKNPFAGQVLA